MISALRSVVSDIGSAFSYAGAAGQAGEVEHALGDDYATVDFGKGYQPSCRGDVDRAAQNRSVPSAQQNGLTPLEPGRIGPTDGQRRDVVQRGLNGLERVGEARLASGGSMPQSLQIFQRNHVGLAE